MDANAESVAKYCNADTAAENMELIATPVRTIASGDMLVYFAIRIMNPVASIDHTNANMVVMYGPPKSMSIKFSVAIIPIDAPKAAALDNPSVYGDAKEFLRMHCMTAPATPNDAPTMMDPNAIGSLQSHITILAVLSSGLNK